MAKQELKNKRKSEPDVKAKTNGSLPSVAETKKSSICSCFNFSFFLVILGVGVALAAIIAKSLELQTQNELMERDIRSAHAGMKTLTLQKEEHVSKINDMEDQIQQTLRQNSKDMKIKDDLISKQKNDIKNANAQKAELTEEILSTATELRDHQLLLENQEAKIKDQEEEKQQISLDLENVKQDSQNVVTDLGAKLQKTKTVVKDQEALIQNLEDNKNALDISITKLEESIQTQKLQIQTLEEEKKSAMDAAEESFTTLQNECDTQAAGLAATIVQHEQALDDSALDIINCQSEMSSKVELLETEQKNCEEATKTLQFKEIETETKNEFLKKEMSEYQTLMQTRYDALQLEMESSTVVLRKEKADLESAMKKKYETLEKQKQEKIRILESSNSQLIEDVKLEKTEKNNLFDDKTELARTLEDLKSENKQLDKNLKVAQVDIGDCLVEKTEIKNKVDDLESKLPELDACTAENVSIKEKVADLEKKLLDKKEPKKSN